MAGLQKLEGWNVRTAASLSNVDVWEVEDLRMFLFLARAVDSSLEHCSSGMSLICSSGELFIDNDWKVVRARHFATLVSG